MLIKKPEMIHSSEITPESVYLNRRQFMKGLVGTAAIAASGQALALPQPEFDDDVPVYTGPDWLQNQLRAGVQNKAQSTDEKIAPYKHAIRHNNFYEFGTGKADPGKNAQSFITDPWSVEIAGEVNKPGSIALEDLIKPHQLEERIVRLRCVEAWSMVLPFVGVPLAELLKRFEPTSKAKYVEFTTLHDPKQMPGQKSVFSTLDWPYVEALRMDEAMHPLAFMAVGMYGNALPPQNGAPLRLVLPWKYGFKWVKSIVRIRFTETMPDTTWNLTAPGEYGFFANVNPAVDHPRWSQASERRITKGGLFSQNRIDTEMFNGYQEVAPLYTNMDLTRYY